MSELTNLYDRIHPPATISRAELLAALDSIQAQIQALIEPAYLAGLVGVEGRGQLSSAMYNVRTLQCWLRRDAAEEAAAVADSALGAVECERTAKEKNEYSINETTER